MLKAELFERTIVFVQRIKSGQELKLYSDFATTEYIGKKHILSNVDIGEIEFGDEQFPNKSLSVPKLNIRITGYPDRLTIFMIDPREEDKHFYEVASKYSEKLVDEDISGIGVNSNFFIPCENPRLLIKTKILDNSPSIFSDLFTAGFRMVYKEGAENCALHVNIDDGAFKIEEQSENDGIIVMFNYHREISTRNIVKRQLMEFREDLHDVQPKILEKINKLMGFFNE